VRRASCTLVRFDRAGQGGVNSGRAVLLYGPPGNGKTSIAERVSAIYGDIIYVPQAIEVDGQIIKVFDPALHKPVQTNSQEDESNSIRKESLDRRYVACKRPVVITGGELTLEMLDLRYDPVAKYYEAPLHIKALGGTFLQGNAATLAADGEGWRMRTAKGPLEARDAVLALGPWADVLTRALGYDLPLAVKRGYHMHYRAAGEARLNHPVLDVERGYFMGPVRRGIRLTTGAEFALRDAIRTPVQLGRAEPIARDLFPLAERLDTEPWMGARPCTPDMLPVIGPAPLHRNLWFAFGHAHHGLTLGAVSGRLVAEMLTGETPFVDPAPYSATRFGA